MSYGSSAWRPWVLDEDDAEPIFRAALEAGINFFDTADMYSLGRSEEVTGRFLRKYGRRDELAIATKVFFPMSDGPNMRGLSRKHILQACEASLKRLGIEAIDLFQIHRIDRHTPIEETLAALDQLVNQGKVHYIGASSMMAWELMKALSVSERRGFARFATMQNHYNLVYREEEREMVPLCESEGLSMIPWSPLARGMLAGTRTKLGDNSTTRSASDAIDQTTRTTRRTWTAPRPGRVQSIEETVQTTEGHPGAGAVAGAIVGGLLGKLFTGRGAGAIIGAAGGAVVGAAASDAENREERTYDVVVHFNDGDTEVFRYLGYPAFQPGQPVTLTSRGLVAGHFVPSSPQPMVSPAMTRRRPGTGSHGTTAHTPPRNRASRSPGRRRVIRGSAPRPDRTMGLYVSVRLGVDAV